MTERTAPRVVLLARAGEARERLGEALSEAGAELALVADPASADPAEAIATRPQAVLVALEPAIEDALERFEALLSDPAVAVIFDEAELAAQRSGWDAARWTRHLAAKLHRHDDVLPPGADEEGDLQPSPGPLPAPRAVAGLDFATLAGEAQQLADDVPRDDVPRDEAPVEDASVEDASVDAPDTDALETAVSLDLEGVDSLELADDDPAEPASPEPAYPFAEDVQADEAAEAPAATTFFGDLTLAALEDDAVEDDALEDALPECDVTGHDVAHEDTPPPVAEAQDGDQGDAASIGMPALDEEPAAAGIELVDVDALLASIESVEGDNAETRHTQDPSLAPAVDLEALEARVSGLSLADVDSYGHGPERGAVLVEGGLGGPDAVRQLLAAIPEGFPRPVLVRLQLDGGRYDRLVKQMGRATQLPVALAEAGHAAEAGTVYFIPSGVSLERGRGRLSFVADEAGERPLLDGLPPGDSALLLMSGSGLDSVEAGMTRVASGLLVAGQGLDGCYDATASNALIARGATVAQPADLAALLAGRWPS